MMMMKKLYKLFESSYITKPLSSGLTMLIKIRKQNKQIQKVSQLQSIESKTTTPIHILNTHLILIYFL